MARYIVAVTHRKEYDIEAESPDDAIAAYWLDETREADRGDVHVGILRRVPQLLLPISSTRTFKVEYRKDGKLVFEHVTKRSTPHEVRQHADKVRTMLVSEMQKPVNEIRVRELAPDGMVGKVITVEVK